jgi:diguanylate cyclase (GGDEF)-like protein/PAS domain S-box-containing protein
MTGRGVEPGDPAKGYVWLFEDISARKRADEEVQRLLKEQDAILENALIGIAFLKDRRVLRCNRRFEEIFGYEPGALLNQPTVGLYLSDKQHASGEQLYDEVWQGSTLGRELRMRKKDGTEFWCFLSGRAVQAGDPTQGSVWLFEDVTADKAAGDRIRQLAHEQELILQNATVGIAFVRNRVIQRSNRYLEQMTGHAPGALLGQSSGVLFAERAEWEAAATDAYEGTEPGQTHEAEVRFKRADGSTFHCRSVGRRIDAGGGEQEWIWSFDDVSAERATLESLERLVAERTAELQAANARLEAEISERKLAEGRARHLADHDALTGLPNRRILEDRLTQALALSYRNRKQTAAMFIDLDRFKTINDSLGHAVGDQLLKAVAERLVKQLRVGDTVCRIGGDEFVVVLPEIVRGADAAQVAQKIIETLSDPIGLEERDITVTPSIGISVFPEDGSDAETLIRNADAAMYHAKEMGRSNYQFFTDQMNLAASRRLTLENDLRRAVQKNELVVYYQPISELKTGCAVMHEALLRWKHPSRGLVSPADFIQLAEDTGLILKIGEQALHDACAWAHKIGVDKRMPVAVNISARQFNDPKLVEMVARTLEETGLPAEMLELEITESTVMRQTDATLAMLKKLKELGVSLAIDDFGTGYSSLAYLKRFPVDKLKIDKSFITDVPKSRDHNAIVTAIIGLAHALSLRVVAEGVETEAQLEFLQGAGCDLIQGYLAGKPIDADSAAAEYV